MTEGKGEKKTYFISGHIDLTQEEFDEEYKPRITLAASQGHNFIVGDARGADTMAQKLLSELNASAIIYHIGTKPRNYIGKFPALGGFKSDRQRDKAMTYSSDDDIAMVRSANKQKELYGDKYKEGRIGGTMWNLMRRNAKNTKCEFIEPS